MSKIPELLRQLADELEHEEMQKEVNLETRFLEMNNMISDVAVRAHNNEDKLHRIGKILMED